MSKKPFNPKDWTSPTKASFVPTVPSLNPDTDIETITTRIVATATDIAPNYADWRDLGFALADALGESGRAYYHRLSRFYPNYTEKETNQQYNKCLKSHGHGITIKTLYHLAKSANIDVSITKASTACIERSRNVPTAKKTKSPNSPNGEIGEMEEIGDLEETTEKPLPTIPETVYSSLPDFLKSVTTKATTPEDRDLLLFGSLVAISPCLPNIYGIYTI